MQELTVASVEKITPRKEGAEPFYVVKGQGGEEMTTFDAAALGWGAGTVVNVEIKVKGKYTNIAKWEMVQLVSAGTLPQVSSTAAGYGDDPAKRLSIERQSTTASFLEFCGRVIAAGVALSPLQQAGLDEAFTWGISRYDDAPATDNRTITIHPTVPTPEDLQRALTQTDKDWKDLESAGSGLDVAWAVNAATRLGWKTTTTLHSWLHSQGIPPVEGETMEEIFANIPGNKVAIIQAAIETRLKEKGG